MKSNEIYIHRSHAPNVRGCVDKRLAQTKQHVDQIRAAGYIKKLVRNICQATISKYLIICALVWPIVVWGARESDEVPIWLVCHWCCRPASLPVPHQASLVSCEKVLPALQEAFQTEACNRPFLRPRCSKHASNMNEVCVAPCVEACSGMHPVFCGLRTITTKTRVVRGRCSRRISCRFPPAEGAIYI